MQLKPKTKPMNKKAVTSEHAEDFDKGATASKKDATKRSLMKGTSKGSAKQPIYKGTKDKHFAANTDPKIKGAKG